MNEEIEYAEMLEIPVSTVNVVRKKRGRKRKAQSPASQPDLKESVIAQVNDKLLENEPQVEHVSAEAELFAESANSAGDVHFGDVPERIDTVRLYSASDKPFAGLDDLEGVDERYALDDLEEGGRYALNEEPRLETRAERRVRIALGAEFAVACALCGAIFLTNVFMPNSAINTFFRTLGENTAIAETDTRVYSDFTLTPVVSELSDTQLTLSETGVLSFTDECCVYPAADGKVSAVTLEEDGTYTLKISHSDSFTGVFNGLETVYYAVGDEVKANIPVAFAGGEAEVQVTMYSDGVLLNCFELTEENCLAWVTQE